MTTTTEHDEILPLLAGEALGGLDADEERRLRVHRSGCDRCAADAAALAEVGGDLALTAPPREPSPSLAARIAAIPRTDDTAASPVALAGPDLDPGGARADHGWRSVLRRPAVSLAALGLAGVLAVVAVAFATQAARLETTVTVQDALIAVLADPNHRTAPLQPEPGTDVVATVVYAPGSKDAFVVATGLPATPTGRVYQLWAADDSGVHPLGTFTFDGTGTFVAPFGVDLATASAAMVTLEPTGGAQGEPGPQVVFGELGPPGA